MTRPFNLGCWDSSVSDMGPNSETPTKNFVGLGGMAQHRGGAENAFAQNR